MQITKNFLGIPKTFYMVIKKNHVTSKCLKWFLKQKCVRLLVSFFFKKLGFLEIFMWCKLEQLDLEAKGPRAIL